ncbi:MAG: sigma-54 dependent transcriptional regulator [Myxococcota bacterium]|nr:sigma-54 dependent transcriptional regulator [Myxococcota bacterium]
MDRLAQAPILIVEDDPRLLRLFTRQLERLGCAPLPCETGNKGLDVAASHPIEAAILDLGLPDMSGMKVMERLRELHPGLPCLIITGQGDVGTAVRAMRAGAYQFLVKPHTLEEVEADLRCALAARSLELENDELRQQLREVNTKRRLLGDSVQIRQLRRVVDQVARSEATVLVSGESGTGKELVVREIHERGGRSERALVSLNCSAVPASLLEAELFGSVAGAYTGATSSRRGRFALADGGTLFLDEVGDMSLEMQAKVLRVLQEQEFEPVGSDVTVHVDTRVIAATNRDLPEMIRTEKFRSDLYYRLNVVPVEVPPLRDHIEDLPLLAAHFLGRSAGMSNGPARELTPPVLEEFAKHSWPGNVREFENLIERILVLGDGPEIDLADLEAARFQVGLGHEEEAALRLPAAGLELSSALATLERSLISQALERSGGNKSNAAKLLGLKRTTFVEKMRRLAAPDLEY